MTENPIVRNAALSKQLQIVAIGELTLGMVVHAIAEQAGTLGVKKKGEIKHLSIIEQLAASGVKSVVVEYPEVKAGQALIKLNAQRNRLFERKKHTLAAIKPTLVSDSSINKLEFDNAANLLKISESIYTNFTTAIHKGQSIDFAETKTLVANVYASLVRNPDALLCMSMIMHSGNYIANHSIHVATLICYFAHQLNWSKEECEKLALIGYLFDVGMVKVPEAIRLKKGTLTESEQDEIKLHVSYSLNILAPLKLNREYLLAIEQHHERLNGSGYPNGYSGSKIHKFSRMLAIVDCYDALITARDHKLQLSPAAAMKVLSNPDYGYDQKLVLQFIRCMGIYPVGSLVALSNKRIGLVTKTNKKSPISPEVKVFYSATGNHFVSPEVIDFSIIASADSVASKSPDNKEKFGYKALRILKPVLASQFGLNMHSIV
ncbi:MAG: HD-GYP domain-containing protein (c-di-GMP phosphodiesterase class II) [Patiriisocius sp.]|jgi:HD-GYP domain-containing protein (c-di-GMP phosphodiesterase class II)